MIEQTSWFQLQPLYRYLRQQSENRQFLKYLEIGATFFLIAIFLFFAIMPTASAISSLVGEINSKKITSEAMSDKISSLLKAQESFSEIQEDYSVVESSYPSLPNFYKTAVTFSYISKETTTPISQINFDLQTDNPENKHNIFGVNLTTAGLYSSIIDSIEKFSNTRRLIDIKSIQISQADKNSSPKDQLNLSISADLYYLSKNND